MKLQESGATQEYELYEWHLERRIAFCTLLLPVNHIFFSVTIEDKVRMGSMAFK